MAPIIRRISLRFLLITIALGIWILVLQNAGIIPTSQNVYIRGGDVGVYGTVSAEIDDPIHIQGSVEISGGHVSVNLSEILGYPVGCRTSYTIDGKEYQSLDVSIR